MSNVNDKNAKTTEGGKGNQPTINSKEGNEEESHEDEENSNIPPKKYENTNSDIDLNSIEGFSPFLDGDYNINSKHYLKYNILVKMGLEGDNDQKENPNPENEQEDVKMKENSQNPNDDVLNVMKRMAQIMSLMIQEMEKEEERRKKFKLWMRKEFGQLKEMIEKQENKQKK